MVSNAVNARSPSEDQLRTSVAEILKDNPDFGRQRFLKALKDKHPEWRLSDRLEKQARLLLQEFKRQQAEGTPPTDARVAEMPMPPEPPAADNKIVDDATEDLAGGGRGGQEVTAMPTATQRRRMRRQRQRAGNGGGEILSPR